MGPEHGAIYLKEELIIPMIGVLMAAAIAGLTSLVVSILSKDQKTSEFRQAWIDGLRSDVADFAGATNAMTSVMAIKKNNRDSPLEYMLSRHDDFAKMEALAIRIRLRLNPIEHRNIITHLNFFRFDTPSSRDQIDQICVDLVTDVQLVLRKEWKRVKRGELSFILLKLFSLVAAAGGGFAGYHFMLKAV